MEHTQSKRPTNFSYGSPFGTRIIVKVDEAIDVTPGGIHIPDNAKERPQFGTVLAVGPKVTEDVKAGDRVVFGKHSGVPLIIADITYYVMQEKELFMVLDQDELDKTVTALLDIQGEAPVSQFILTTDSSNYSEGETATIFIPSSEGCKITIEIYHRKKLISADMITGHEYETPYSFKVEEGSYPELTVNVVRKSYKPGAMSFDENDKVSATANIEILKAIVPTS